MNLAINGGVVTPSTRRLFAAPDCPQVLAQQAGFRNDCRCSNEAEKRGAHLDTRTMLPHQVLVGPVGAHPLLDGAVEDVEVVEVF
jgi:hypothetical protein